MITVFTLTCFISCDSFLGTGSASADTDTGKELNGLVKKYRQNKSLLSEANYKDGVLHGQAKNYYDNGKVKTEMHYVDGVKHGIAITFYESGEKYQETPYSMGKKDGIVKIYHKNGKTAAEIPYKNNFAGMGLKEYLSSGKKKESYPELKIEAIDNLAKTGEYIVLVYFAKDRKRAEYFVGDLTDGVYMNDSLFKLPTQDGRGVMKFKPPAAGVFLMEKVNFVANLKTPTGNPFVVQKEYNVAIDF